MNRIIAPLIDLDEVQKALAVVVAPSTVFEIRILDPRGKGNGYAPRVIYGYFDNPAIVPDAIRALRLEGAKGIYITLNPVNPALLARSYNRFTRAKEGQTTADRDIVSREWLLVDIDPKRPAGISASDEEKAHAQDRAQAVNSHLKKAGWPEPIFADSGNGFHLLYRVGALTETETVKQCLEALNQQFSDEAVGIDTTVFNPARIVKLYGTRAEKGDDCPDLCRPHRLSLLINVPTEIDPVSPELLLALASSAVTGVQKNGPSNRPSEAYGGANGIRSIRSSSTSRHSWDRTRVQEFIDRNLVGCHPGPATPYDGGFKWVLGVCPFNHEHTNRSAVIVIKANGVLGFKCQHDGCNGNNWKALRARFEPKVELPHEDNPPTALDVPDDDVLMGEYGPPIMFNSKGEPSDVNQMFIAARYARDHLILFEPTLNQFYSYDPPTGLWKPKTEARLMVELGNALRDILNEYGSGMILKKRTENLLGQIMRLLKGMIERAGIFQRTKPIVHVGNGVLHLDTVPPTLKEFSPDYYSRNRSEIIYDPEAKCPRFLAELLQPALDEPDISLLQRYAGQCLFARNPAQKILLLRGTPGGGKSTLVNVLETVVGTYNVTQLRVQHLAERFEVAGFVGKTVLCGKDVPGDFLNNKSAYVLKALVGGDRLDAEQKNVKHRFELLGEFNVIITSNTRLRVRLDADSGAWKRRLLIVDYEHPPTEKPIPNFHRFLVETEGPGILNWCIAGILQLLEELRTAGHFQLTKAQEKRVDAVLSESDSVRHFVGEQVINDPTSNLTVGELQTAYHNFCDEQGWQAVTVRQFENAISDIMMELHRVAKRTDIKRNEKSQRGFAHVGLKGSD